MARGMVGRLFWRRWAGLAAVCAAWVAVSLGGSGCKPKPAPVQTEVLLDTSGSLLAKESGRQFAADYLSAWLRRANIDDTLTIWAFLETGPEPIKPVFTLTKPILRVPANKHLQGLIVQQKEVLRSALEPIPAANQSPILEGLSKIWDLREGSRYDLVLVSDLLQTSPGGSRPTMTMDTRYLDTRDDRQILEAMGRVGNGCRVENAPRQVAVHWYYGSLDPTQSVNTARHKRIRELFREFFTARRAPVTFEALKTSSQASSAAPSPL